VQDEYEEEEEIQISLFPVVPVASLRFPPSSHLRAFCALRSSSYFAVNLGPSVVKPSPSTPSGTVVMLPGTSSGDAERAGTDSPAQCRPTLRESSSASGSGIWAGLRTEDPPSNPYYRLQIFPETTNESAKVCVSTEPILSLPRPRQTMFGVGYFSIRSERIARWLDWWCSSQWRAFASFIVLALLSFTLVNLLEETIYNAAGLVARQLSQLLPLPPGRIEDLWTNSATWLLLVWYQPVLLRVTLLRGLVWTCAPLLSILAFVCIDPPGDRLILSLFLLALSSLQITAIWNHRRPRWVLAIAVAVYGTTPYWFGSESEVGLLVATGLYAAVLFFGTRKISVPQPAIES
jgi:hypothetical protein